VRRATFDLTGLPPTPAEIKAFTEDQSPDAYEKLIDRLLASPHYGERWGRHWLDVVRYADTKGYVFEEERRYAASYTYRDWVIRALNDDLPYDQFLIQQIAADRLDLKQDKRPLAALGFLTLGRRFLNNPPDIIDDRIDVVTRGTMALTVSCARCHDHKYDPIPTADYYSLYGVFASSREPEELPVIAPATMPAEAADYEKQRTNLRAQADDFRQKRQSEIAGSYRTAKAIAAYLLAAQKLGEGNETKAQEIAKADGIDWWMLIRWRDYLKTAVTKNPAIFSPWSDADAKSATQPAKKLNRFIAEALAKKPGKQIQELAAMYATVLAAHARETSFPDAEEEALRLVLYADDSPTNLTAEKIAELFTIEDNRRLREFRIKLEELAATHPGAPQRAMAMEDLPAPVEAHVFMRGNPGNVGKAVPRQFPAILSPDDRKPFVQGSGRLELAKAIASKDNPLTARVMVNRVWQYHFGRPLVTTPSDFGTRGERPTHPDLLDYLALRFVNEDAWSLKRLHKRIMLSATYRQSSVNRPEANAIDPENRWLWRQNRQRLDFEAMRDSVLAASGQLDSTIGGKSVDILAEPFSHRRTIYAFIDRQNLPGTFRTFDFASPDATSAQRFETSVPQQALFMMNSPFVIEQARKTAARSDDPAKTDASHRITQLYNACLGRDPSQREMALGLAFIANESAQPPATQPAIASAWQYGYGEFDESSPKPIEFHPMPHFTGTAWEGGPVLPDPNLGWAMLNATGGHPGNDPQHAVIRRWTADRQCAVTVDGELSHPSKEGDGVRGRLIASHDGLLATYIVHNRSAATRISDIQMKPGDTIDFVVDCGPAGNVGYDAFAWKVTITKLPIATAAAGDDAGATWKSEEEFHGPAKPVAPLSPWEKYAQVVLESNEFAFVN